MSAIVNLIGVFLIVLTGWFFFMKKELGAVKAEKTLRVVVDGGYSPSHIEIPVNQTTTLEFFRTDPTSCLEEVVFPDFGVREYLPVRKKVAIELHPTQKGEFPFHCGMSMFFGKVTVT